MTFNEKIVILRKERKWSQGELARKIGVHVAHLSKIENAKSSTTIEIFKKLVEVFGVSADYLLNDDSDEIVPIKITDKNLAEKLNLIDALEDEDRKTIINVIESMLTKQKMLDLLTKQKSAS